MTQSTMHNVENDLKNDVPKNERYDIKKGILNFSNSDQGIPWELHPYLLSPYG